MKLPFITRRRIESELIQLEEISIKRGYDPDNPGGYGAGLYVAAARLRNRLGLKQTEDVNPAEESTAPLPHQR